MAVKNWQLEAQVWKDSGKGHGGRLGNFCVHPEKQGRVLGNTSIRGVGRQRRVEEMQRPDSKQSSLWKGLDGKGSNSAKMVGPGWRAVCVCVWGGCTPQCMNTLNWKLQKACPASPPQFPCPLPSEITAFFQAFSSVSVICTNALLLSKSPTPFSKAKCWRK